MMKMAEVKDIFQRIGKTAQSDGGALELVCVKNGVVTVRVKGNCVGCPVSILGMEGHLKTVLQSEIPEVRKVEIVI
jgi:Fe-S cluster biogenesis protein NfuA